MKLSPWPTAILSTSFFASANATDALDYTVKKGDIFTKIVEQAAFRINDLTYSQILALTLKLNNKENLSDFNHLKVGQKIKLPNQQEQLDYLSYYHQKYPPYWNPSTWKSTEVGKKYIIRPGDTLSKIAKKVVPELPMLGKHGSVQLMVEKNKSILDINKIFVGQEVLLPNQQEIIAFKQRTKPKRLPASPKKVPAKKPSLQIDLGQYWPGTSPPLNLNEFSFSQKNCLRLFHKDLLVSCHRLSTLKALKSLLELSRESQNDRLESFYLKMISLFLRPENEEIFMQQLASYLKSNKKLVQGLIS